MTSLSHFDFIVVGAGSAGCAVAARLSENPAYSVCLLEAGGADKSSLIHAPLGFAATAPLGLFNWNYNSIPQAGLGGRRGYAPRGKIMGGSSSLNAMVYTRGNRYDYDEWARLGNEGWSYDDLLPLFKQSENSHCFSDNDYHGNTGPLHVSWLRSPSALNEAFLQACESQGLPRNPDYNGAEQWGCSPAQVTQHEGKRCSAAKAYITPHLDRPNLHVIRNAHVCKLLTTQSEQGLRATAVEFIQDGQRQTIHAQREIVLSAGAFGSAQILMLSGIGPAQHLRDRGIPVVHPLSGVGQNLQDHLTTVLIYRTREWQDTLGFSLRGGWSLLSAIAEWRKKRTGWITTNVAETQGFLKTRPDVPAPDIQLALCVGIVDDHTRKSHWGHGYTIHATLMRPESRGQMLLASADPQAAPLIDPAYLQSSADQETLARGTCMAYDIMESPALSRHRGAMIYPFPRHDPQAVQAFLQRHSDTEYHPVGTCKMGMHTDPLAVVDAQLRVHGVQGLRVADASIMPNLITGNTNAPTIVIGEKAAQLMRAQHAT